MSVINDVRLYFRDAAERQGPPPVPAGITLKIPRSDPQEEVGKMLSPGKTMPAEGQSFIIHYVDSGGNASLRRITVWSIEANLDGIPMLVAKCHERKATRSFRVDRIHAVTDFDGVLREPLTEFFRDTFGFHWSPSMLPLISEADDQEDNWVLATRYCRQAGVPLLVALALADGEMCLEEIGEIADFAARACAKRELELSETDAARLIPYIRRMRPGPSVIDAVLDRLLSRGPAAITEVLHAGVRVIEADGMIHEDEAAMLRWFAKELTGADPA